MDELVQIVVDEDEQLKQFLQYWEELMKRYPWATAMSQSDQMAIKCFIHWQQRKERHG